MLLKISDGASGWVLFDQVDNVHYSTIKYAASDLNEVDAIDIPESKDRLVLVSKECFNNGKQLELGLLEFERCKKSFAAIYTDVAYICDNNGNTVERVSVANRNKRN